jgi:hypothetical protein
MMWVGHVVLMGKTRNPVKILGGNPEYYIGNPNVREYRRIILKLTSMEQRGGARGSVVG